MIKKIIVALVVVLAVSSLVFATFENSGNKTISNNSTNNSNGTVKQVVVSNNTTHTTTQTNILAQEVQKIASKYILVSGARAGTPKLMELNGEKVYIVPIVIKGTTVGEIDIDAKTGKNVGGAGGSP